MLAALEEARAPVLTTHLNADGDGTGCQGALVAYFLERGADPWIVNPTPFPDRFRFLIPEERRILHPGSEEAMRRCQAADLCVVVDTGEVSRIGRVKPMVDHVPKVIIDHHPPGERAIEGLAVRDAGAAAAGELVFDLLTLAGGPWDRSVVEGLYVAILTDTGSFRFSNSTPGVHRVAAELISRGASPDELHRRVYGSFPLRRFRLLERALATLDTAHRGQVAWMSVPPDDFRRLGCDTSDLEGMVDIPREVEGAEVALLFRELDDGGTKVSFRSNGDADVNRLARSFGGGGHVKAAGAVVDRPMTEAIPLVVDAAGALLSADATSGGGTAGGGGK
jgi:bifunctional oligoribonuclease and PAP phosphatase NrnA